MPITDKKEFYAEIVKRNGFTGEITGVDVITPDLHSEHFASACISVTVRRKEGEPVELFVKCFTSNEQHSEMLRNLGSFDKESAFFNVLLPALRKIVDQRPDSSVPYDLNVAPRCFYADGEMIVMDNLAKKNYTLLDKIVGQTLDQAKMVLRNLAKLHATSYILLSQFTNHTAIYQAYPFLRDNMTSEFGGKEMDKIMTPIFNVAIQVLQKRKQSEEERFAITWLNDAVEAGFTSRMREYLKEQSGHVCTVVNHGDCWNSNMLFQRDPETMEIINHIFIDFQIVRVGSPCLDIGYYMFTTLQRHVRKTEWKTLLRYYYNHLLEDVSVLGGKINFTFTELVEDFQKKFVPGFMFGLCMGGFMAAMENFGDLEKIEGNPFDAMSATIRRWVDENPELAEKAGEGLLQDFALYRELTGEVLS